jgi:DNA polymerase alpha subunit A
LYETYILLLDFNSLYPSIIQEYNICFTTMDWAAHVAKMASAHDDDGGDGGGGDGGGQDDEAALHAVEAAAASGALPPLPDDAQDAGVVPKVIRTIIQRRVAVKGILKQEKDPAKRQTLDIRQKALKLTANSLYGCLGFANSRFYAKPIAALVTAMGRETLQRTVDLAQTQLNLEVIYGDTDSIMINTASTDLAVVKKLGQDVKREVNKLYKTLELEVDGIFKSMLLLKKKKYAALVVEEKPDGSVGYVKETKGLDLVRRDWCRLSKTLGQFVLDQILSGRSREAVVDAIHARMDQVAAAVRAAEVPVEEFVVTKGMNKAIKDYPDAKSLPHLQVALAMLKEGKPVNTGDHIPYVICVDTAPGAVQATSFAQRAFHPDAVAKSEGKLAVDYEWYLTQQILPPIARLCEPIDGTSTALLAERLGLDGAKFARLGGGGGGGDEDGAELCDYVPACKQDDAERFKGTSPLVLPCGACGQSSAFKGAVCFSLGTANQTAAGASASAVSSLSAAAAGSSSSSSSSSSAGGLRSGLVCGPCGAEYLGTGSAPNCFATVSNLLSLAVRADKAKYYAAWLVCDDASCLHRTQQQSVVGNVCLRRGCNGRVHAEFSEKQLHAQLKYYHELFDDDACVRKQKLSATAQAAYTAAKAGSSSSGGAVPEGHRQVCQLLKQQVGGELDRCGYNWVPKDFWAAAFDAMAGKGGK